METIRKYSVDVGSATTYPNFQEIENLSWNEKTKAIPARLCA